MRKKPTIRDVAKKAGVSVATVSYVLNDNPDEVISEQAKKRVLDAVRALNYHRAAAAVGLARQRTRNIGIVLYLDDNAVTNQFYSFVIQGVIRETMERDWNLLFSYIEATYRDSQDLPKVIREANVAGVLFVSRIVPRMLRDILESGIPVVAVDNYPAMRGISSIQIDNRGGGERAARYLAELGHRHLAFVGSVVERPSIVLRCDGFARALEKGGLPFSRERDIVPADTLTFDEGYGRSRELLRKNKKVTALFCANDEIAAGAIRAARELGRSIPADLSIVGFDNIIMGNYTDPPLTTIAVDKEQMGRRAAARLIEMLDGKSSDPVEEAVAAELVVRGSAGPPAGGTARAARGD
jgi:LacI family transcriptional regulator